MDPALNPYTPGSGRKPPSLQGRDSEVDTFDLLVAKAGHRVYDRGMMLTGLRGVGKTSLLNHLRANAENHGWYTVDLEAQTSSGNPVINHKRLAAGLKQGLRRYSRKHQVGQLADRVVDLIDGSSLTIGPVSISTPGRVDESDIFIELEELIEEVCGFARKSGTAFALFIDEMQDLDPVLMSALVMAQHKANQEDWPFYIIGAGLPSLPAILSEARSYAERLFLYRIIGPLGVEEAQAALRDPAERMGGGYTLEALDVLSSASEGYPYFLQEFGKAIWDLAPGTPFTSQDATDALEIGQLQLDQGFYPSRWERATPAERRYLRAIAETGEPQPKTASLSIPQNTAGPLRGSLIKKGILYSPERGRIAFTVPGMGAFIERQPDDDS